MTVNIVQNTSTASVSSTTSDSFDDCILSIDGYSDPYRIREGSSSFIIVDQPFTQADGVYSATVYRLDYRTIYRNDSYNIAYAPKIVIDRSNRVLPVTMSGSTQTLVYITTGAYTVSELATAIQTALAGYLPAETFIVSTVGGTVPKIQFSCSSKAFTFNFATMLGTTGESTELPDILGYDYLDYNFNANTYYYTSPVLPRVLRLSRPITTNRESAVYLQSSKEAGKIFMIDVNTFSREFPFARIEQGVPNRFCVAARENDGQMVLRFNAVPQEEVRIELNYIPIHSSLQDSTGNFPKLPAPYTKFLVYGAAYFLLLEKSDSKAQQYFSMAQVELQAMVNDSKKSVSLSGQNYGRLVPRANRGRYYGL